MTDYLADIVAFFSHHPYGAAVAVFLINLAESLVVVGLFVPGTVIMFSIGALVALGAMGLWTTLACAVAGALVGDGVSYLIGRYYREHLRELWPFSRHPQWLERAERFFVRHGAKSVVLGRFMGPIRPIIPAVAGMMGMASGRFYRANFLSAITWAPAYILPGVVLGASLSLASKVATRLTLVILLLSAVVWLTVFLVHQVYALLQPRAERIVLRLLAWGRVHPMFREVTVGLLDPTHHELKGLVEIGAVLLFGGWIFFAVLLGEIGFPQPLSLDYQAYYLLQELRTHWADQVMVFLSEFADTPVNISVAFVGLIWFAVRRHWLVAAHWTAAVVMAALVGLGLNYLLPSGSPRPDIYLVGMSDAFPSVHAAVVSTLYGFLAVLAAGELSSGLRRLPYTVAAVWITLVAVAHLYLGRHWLSDVVGGVTLGLLWSGIVGIAYRSHVAVRIDLRGLWIVLAVTILFVGGGHVVLHHNGQLLRYESHRPQSILEVSRWWESDWQRLAAYRVDWGGGAHVPMTIQAAGDLAEVSRYLQQYGWRTLPLLDTARVLRIFLPDTDMKDLPILPYAHDGHQEALQLTHPGESGETSERLVLHLWRGDAEIGLGHVPLWVGCITRQHLAKPLGLITLPKTEPEYVAPLLVLRSALGGIQWRKANRPGPYPEGWDGTVLLLRMLGGS